MKYLKNFLVFVFLIFWVFNFSLIYSVVSNYYSENKCSNDLTLYNEEMNKLLIKLNIDWQGKTKEQLHKELSPRFSQYEFYSKEDVDIILNYEIHYENNMFKEIRR